MSIAKEFYFSTSVITIPSNVLRFSFAKRVECRYNHNVKFSLHAKMSVVTFSFIIHKVSSCQPGKFHKTILLYRPCSISYRSLPLLTLLISLIFCFVPLRHVLQKSLHPVLLSSLIRLSMIFGAINNR